MVLCGLPLWPGACEGPAYHVMGAQNMIEGNAFSRTPCGGEAKPATGISPRFSAALALFGLSSMDKPQVGRTINAVSFEADVLIVGGLVYH
jgi:hypothetical protein